MAIRVFWSDGKGWVYDKDDAKRLRTECRLVGSTAATSEGEASKRRNRDGSLPLQLGREEVALAVKKGWAELAATDAAHRGPTVALQELAGTEGVTVELQSGQGTLLPPSHLQPSTELQKTRCAVFEDLHTRGFFLTSGLKFGGAWLAYPGDPLVYHAQFVVRVVDPSTQLSPLSHIAAAREAHAARKHLLLAFTPTTSPAQTDRQTVHYITVAPYDGFGQADRRNRD